MKLQLLLYLILITATSSVLADSIVVTTSSYHTKYNAKFNNNNFGIGYEANNVGVHVYRNSLDKPSIAFTASIDKELSTDFVVSAGAVLAFGYYNYPIAFPVFAVRYEHIRIISSYPIGTSLGLFDIVTAQLVIPLN